MSNIKLKDHNWAAEGIYDTNQSKSQQTINSDVNTKIGQATLQTSSQNLSGATNELKGRADTLDSKYDNVVTVANTQPSSEYNKVWLPLTVSEGTQVPTWAEHQALQAQVNELPDIVNPNILDNWYFVGGGSQAGAGKFPINLRGQTSYANNVRSINRWSSPNSNITVNLNSNYLEIVTTAAYMNFRQDIENIKIGYKYTASILFSDGTLLYGTTTPQATGAQNFFNTSPVAMRIGEASVLSITPISAGTIRIVAVKLELGDTQTLCHNEGSTNSPVWVLNEIPNYQEQLVKCIGSHADSGDDYANNDYANLIGALKYKSGDTVTTVIRSVGRVTNAGNAIYTSIVLDRPVSVNYANVNVTASNSQNVVPVNTSQATGGLSTSTVTAVSVSNNIVTVSFPTVNSGLTVGAVYYLELNVTITFN